MVFPFIATNESKILRNDINAILENPEKSAHYAP